VSGIAIITEACTSRTACYQPGVCPVGAIYSEEVVLVGFSKTKYNSEGQNKATTTRSSSGSAETSSLTRCL
jgi:hypothetical protein